VIDEGRTVLTRSGEEIIDLLKGGQGVLNIVPMGAVVSEVDAAIHELGLPAGGTTVEAPGGASPAAGTGG
jgi:hypothetical protein